MNVVSTIPSVIDYLYQVSSTKLTDVLVTDGAPRPPEDQEPDLLCLAFTGQIGEPAVENTRFRQQAATAPDRETYEITCVSSSWRGHDNDAKTVRDAAYAIINKLGELLAMDQTLGGLVMRTRLMTDLAAQEQTDKGAVCTIRFVIQVDAFTRR